MIGAQGLTGPMESRPFLFIRVNFAASPAFFPASASQRSRIFLV
jgi:hypothetical protein